MNRVLTVGTFFAAQGLMQRVDLSSDAKAVESMMDKQKEGNLPKCIALVGLPFLGSALVAAALKKEYGFEVVGPEVPLVEAPGPVLNEEEAEAVVKKIEEAMIACTAPCIVIDDLLTDNETYKQYEKACQDKGLPKPVNIVYFTSGNLETDAELAGVKIGDADPLNGGLKKDADSEPYVARVAAVKATLDKGGEGEEEAAAAKSDHYLNKPVVVPWTPEYFKKLKELEEQETKETPGHPSKVYQDLQAEVKEAKFPTVQKIEIPKKNEEKNETDAMVMAGVVKEVAKIVKPTVHCVLAPQARGVSVTLASVLAASAAGRQVVVDAVELATPNSRYSETVNTALKTAAAVGEPILPDIWAEIFEERLKEYSLQHVFLANYPGDSVRTYPTVRDELDVLAQFATVKGMIAANFTQRAMHKYCFKGSVEAPETAAEAFAYYRGTPVTDVERYSSMLAAKTSYLKEVDMEREKWVTNLEIDATDDALPQAAREGALAVLDLLQMLP